MIPGSSKYASRVLLTRPPCLMSDVIRLQRGSVGNTIGGSKTQPYLHTSVTLVYGVEQQLWILKTAAHRKSHGTEDRHELASTSALIMLPLT
jgi:hypothetical protein